MGFNLNLPTRPGGKPRAREEVPILSKGPRVGAVQAPAHTHNVPSLASSPIANTLNECKRARKREAKQDWGPHGFPGKLPQKVDFL